VIKIFLRCYRIIIKEPRLFEFNLKDLDSRELINPQIHVLTSDMYNSTSDRGNMTVSSAIQPSTI